MGEVAEYEAARILGVELTPARQAEYMMRSSTRTEHRVDFKSGTGRALVDVVGGKTHH